MKQRQNRALFRPVTLWFCVAGQSPFSSCISSRGYAALLKSRRSLVLWRNTNPRSNLLWTEYLICNAPSAWWLYTSAYAFASVVMLCTPRGVLVTLHAAIPKIILPFKKRWGFEGEAAEKDERKFLGIASQEHKTQMTTPVQPIQVALNCPRWSLEKTTCGIGCKSIIADYVVTFSTSV